MDRTLDTNANGSASRDRGSVSRDSDLDSLVKSRAQDVLAKEASSRNAAVAYFKRLSKSG